MARALKIYVSFCGVQLVFKSYYFSHRLDNQCQTTTFKSNSTLFITVIPFKIRITLINLNFGLNGAFVLIKKTVIISLIPLFLKSSVTKTTVVLVTLLFKLRTNDRIFLNFFISDATYLSF